MKKTITQAAIEAARATVLIVTVTRDEEGAEPRNELISMESILGRPVLEQPTFYWSATGKYTELRNFRLEANNTFQRYNTNNQERLSIIKN